MSPDLGDLTLLVKDFVTPNGLAFSPDESILYINDTRRGHIRAFDMQPNGTLAIATDHVFGDLRGERSGVPDGMKVDVEGNVYCGGSGGIWVFDPSGNHLGIIVHGEPATTNMAWGGEDWTTLFFTTRDSLGRISLRYRVSRCHQGNKERAPEPTWRIFMLPNMFDSGLTRGPGLTRRGAKSGGGRKGVNWGGQISRR